MEQRFAENCERDGRCARVLPCKVSVPVSTVLSGDISRLTNANGDIGKIPKLVKVVPSGFAVPVWTVSTQTQSVSGSQCHRLKVCGARPRSLPLATLFLIINLFVVVSTKN